MAVLRMNVVVLAHRARLQFNSVCTCSGFISWE